MGSLYLAIECYRGTAAACVDIQYTYQYTIAKYDLSQLYQNLPYLNVPGTWYLSWKRIPTRNGLTVGRLHLDIECYRRTAAVRVDSRYTSVHHRQVPGIRYDLAQLYQKKTLLNVPGTWYLSWKRSPTQNGLNVADYISTTANVIVARLLLSLIHI